MMSDIPEPEHIVLADHLARALTAHEAVQMGIATHAQKEHDRRDMARRKLEAERKLQVSPGGSG